MKKTVLYILVGLVVIVILVAVAGFVKFNILGDDVYIQTKDGVAVKYNDIDTYLECEAAGYPVRESYPEQCALPDGRVFVREI